VSAITINRFCSSGLQAVAQGASAILAGWQDVVLAGGIESMSQVAMGGQKPSPHPGLMAERPAAYTPMGITAEIVADRFGVSRADQDTMAYGSHMKAISAIKEGRFADEIIPIKTRVQGPDGWKDITFSVDEGPRPTPRSKVWASSGQRSRTTARSPPAIPRRPAMAPPPS